jgi:predicted CoA-binding protein
MNFKLKMLQKDLIEFFLSQPIIAVVGVSGKKDNPANHIYKRFRELDYTVFPVNPNASEVEGDPCYATLEKLPLAPSAVMLAGRPEVSEELMHDCARLNVSVVWMHRGIGPGSYSRDASDLARKYGIKAIVNGCPMMFLGKVDPFHKVLSWFK